MKKIARFVTVLTLSALFVISLSMNVSAINPFLPMWEFIPDSEPYVFEDPDNPGKYRVYVYGSHDTAVSQYCGPDMSCWSAPVDDLTNWRPEGNLYDTPGVIFRSPNSSGTGFDTLYAPDVAMRMEEVDGKMVPAYYLYPNNQAGGRNTMVAKSYRPDGPFEVTNWASASKTNTVGDLGFDPSVFVDDDGRVYGYWGFETSYGAELDPTNMHSIKPGTQTITNMIGNRKSSEPFQFFEASSMRKIKDKYVFIYARGGLSSEAQYNSTGVCMLAYAYGDSPLGPFTYGGVIVDAAGQRTPDGASSTNNGHNTHGSLFEADGEWYITYHRAINNHGYSRQTVIEPLDITVEEGPGGKVIIPQVNMSSSGPERNGLNPYENYSAGIICYQLGGPYVVANRDKTVNNNHVTNLRNNSTVGIVNYNFDIDVPEGSHTHLDLDIIPLGRDGSIEVYIGDPLRDGKLAGTIPITADMPRVRTTVSLDVADVVDDLDGQHPLFLKTKGSGSNNIWEFHRVQFTAMPPEDIKVDGKDFLEFNSSIYSYTYTVTGDEIPTVTAGSLAEGMTATVTQATALFDSAKVTFSSDAGSKTYLITFVPESTTRFTSLPSGWSVVNPSSTAPSFSHLGATVIPSSGDFNGNNTNTLQYKGSLAGDWEITTKVTNDQLLSDEGNYPQYGVALHNGDDWLKLVNVFGYNNAHSIQNSIAGSLTGDGDNDTFTAHPYLTSWLRLTKSGNTIVCSYSSDGVNFTTTRTITVNNTLDKAKLQLFASTCFGSQPFKTTFEYVNIGKAQSSAFVEFKVSPQDTVIEIKDSSDNVITPISGYFYELPVGSYTYTASAEGYVTETKDIQVSQNAVISVELKKDYSSMYSISMDGEPFSEFNYYTKSYTHTVESGDIPTITAQSTRKDVTVKVTQATNLWESAKVEFISGSQTDAYLITFVPESATRFNSLPADWELLNANDKATFAETGITIPASNLSSGNDFPSTSILNMLQYTGSLNGDWTVTVKVTNDRLLPDGGYPNYGIGLNNTGAGSSNWVKMIQIGGSNPSWQYNSGFQSSNNFTGFNFTTAWLRLQKEGSNIIGYYSSDGVNFSRANSFAAGTRMDGAKLQLFSTTNQESSTVFNTTFEYIHMEKDDQPVNSTITFAVTPANAAVVVTNSEGSVVAPTSSNALIYDLAPGQYNYSVSAEGFQTKSATFTADGNKTITVDLSQAPADKYAITFAVTPANAAVEVRNSAGDVVSPTATNALIYDLAPGEYSYTVSAQGYQTKTSSFTVGAQATITVELTADSTPVDKTELETVAEEAEALNQAEYTPETWAVLRTALNTAKDVLSDDQADQGAVDSALAALRNAIAQLKEIDPGEIIEVEAIRIEGDETVKRNKTVKLTAVIDPENATIKDVTWVSLNPAIATVDQNGIVKATSKTGFAIIEAKAHNGVIAQFSVRVTA
ncbi:family 43 glycosylhydrolase [Oscillospiraceae bacterium MB08-C2-2]|nr:family 43 glycosylhydrolase [Oscillospiraceae bacterium MB08-C2-2]